MRDVLIFFAVSIPVLLGLQTVWADIRAASPNSAAVLLAKHGYLILIVEFTALFLPFFLGALVAGVLRRWTSRRKVTRGDIRNHAKAILLLSALGWGIYLWVSPIGDYLRARPSFDLILMLALVPVLVALIYALVFPVTARFLVARRGVED